MRKLGLLVLGLLCGILLPLTTNAKIEDGIYTVEGGHKTVIRSGIQLTLASGALEGTYYRGFNENTDNSEWIGDSNDGTGTYYFGGKMYGNTNTVDDAWGGSGDNVENGFNSGLNPARQGPCESGRHVPSKGERSNLHIARCNNDVSCDVSVDLNIDNEKIAYIDNLVAKFSETFNIQIGGGSAYWLSSPYYNLKNSGSLVYRYYDGVTIDVGARQGNFKVLCFKDVIIKPQTYKVSFFSGNQLVTSGEIIDGGLRNEDIPSATKEGYDFDYRYVEGAEDTGFNFSGTAITGNISLYAKWTTTEYEITYNLNDGTESRTNPTTYTVESGTFGLYQPTKTGYMFLGWTGSNGNSVNANIYITKGSTGDRTYTAVWGNFEDIDAYFISDTGVVSYITLMDRNMGATEVYNGSSYSPNTGSYGFHYQWGNNNGFQIGCWTDPCSDQVTTNATSIKVLGNSNYDNKGYNGIIFISSGYDYWVGNNHYDGLWGGSGDAESNNWRLDTMTLGSVRDRQGPCPDGYHVPSAGEWQKLSEYRCKSNLNYCTWSGTYQYFDLSLGGEFLSYFKIPFAGYRTTNGWIKDVNDETQYEYGAYYRSSSPRDVSKLDRAWGLYYNPYDIYFDYINHRSSAQSIRCFSNDYLFTDSSMIIHPNGGTGAMILVEGSKIKSLGNPKRVNSKFEGWYDSDTEGNKMKNGSDAPTNLYARWSCKSGYVENNSGTGCIELYTIAYELNDGILSGENVTGYTIESDDITLINPTKTGYTFTGWSGTDIDGFSGTVVIPSGSTGYRVYEANRTPIEYEITYELNGGTNSPNNVTLYTIESNITFENPTKNGYNFDGWFTDVQFTTGITAIPVGTTGPIIIYAKWTKIETKPSGGSSGGGGGGGGGGSSKTDTGSASSQTGNQINSNTGDTASTGTNIKEPETNTGSSIQTGSQQPLSPTDSSPDREQTVTPLIGGDGEAKGGGTQTYTQEFQEAYEFAKGKGITTMPTIQKADMDGKLTRIAMAKMLSQYAMNVLGQKPANIVTPKFNDVSDKQNSDYDDGVTLAYQLGIMGQNMPNNKFRPNDEVTRAEFATALSRMIYHTSDGEYKSTPKYYIHHMEKLVKEGIITKDDPNMKELRGYVMIMLMRSAK